MKILLLGFSKLKFMPYANFYLDNIDSTNEIHLVIWNRDCVKEVLNNNSKIHYHEFYCFQEDQVSRISKIGSFVKYKKYAEKLIKTIKPDVLISLHSLPAVLLFRTIIKHYKGRFIFDYRDFTYENNGLFKKVICKLVNVSKATFISSDGFRKNLPRDCNDKIVVTHNIRKIDLAINNICPPKTNYGVISVSFWGFIRQEELNKKIIDAFSKDKRFELHYYGKEGKVYSNLIDYTRRKNTSNIFFHGEYLPEERITFAEHTFFIHNMYDGTNSMLAMSNKYYDSIIFKRPQICLVGSFMAEHVDGKKLGVVVNVDESSFTSKLFEYCNSFDFDDFSEKCDKERKRVLDEYNKSISILKSSINEISNSKKGVLNA